MLKNLMARLGHGAAKVDLVLNRNQFALGEFVEGTLVIQGGTVQQSINKIDVRLMVIVRSHESEATHLVTSIPFHQSFTIHPGERKEFPFQYQLPNDLLLSGNYVTYFFQTELDIAGGVDQTDRDYIEILPPQSLQQILLALEQLGFREKHDSRMFNGYVQEFAFFPTSYLNGQVQELEFAATLLPEGVRLQLELDLYSHGREQEVKREVFIYNDQLQSVSELTSFIQEILDEMVQHPHSAYHMEHHYGYHEHHGSGMGEAIGGFIAGAVGGMAVSELLDDDDKDDDKEENEDDEGFLEDLFEEDDD
ncbi:sporulation protein [Polycladomyces sp. WAk]|uniref:Sporulation protein n=1 Tax=Polycladomyces zharkentensis TaxID=2807616 RepID=A0ABS2WHK5_9BACL|nr:sporulation protein [Polycladomyces sp. WAk]MBN2909037.1 sporulation protein [Polycladomyces sp. WAk]